MKLLKWQRELVEMMARGPVRLVITRRGTAIVPGATRKDAEELYRRVRRQLREGKLP